MQNNRLAITLIACLILAGLQGVAIAQSKKPAAKQPAPPATNSETPAQIGPQFEPELEALPPKFLGNDIEALYRSLLMPPKGEFETATEYEARKQLIQRATYAFKLPDVFVKYDAETEEYSVKLNRFPYVYRSSAIKDELVSPALVIKRASEQSGKYSASNAYGVTAEVESSHEKTWSVLPTGKFLCWSTTIKVPRDKAKDIKNRLSTLVVASIGPESAPQLIPGMKGWGKEVEEATGKHVISATLSRPKDVYSYFYSISANVEGIWIYDFETGEVFRKSNVLDKDCDIDLDIGKKSK